ncbi:unnamed protein product [Rhizoctonia solani]|uniref:Ricin B lectin domain-containing protein n=1 Tax=Rhizoctonia solani TaxID=456999 RepID=A0A8H3AYH5_9AGAM|nr:unnamed protein product [Rhizoctonia solani]
MAMTLDTTGDIHKVQGRAFNGQGSQKWVFTGTEGSMGYTIKNVGSGTYVGFTKGQQAERDQIVTASSNTVAHALIGDAGTGYMIVANYRPSLVLDLTGGSRTDGTAVKYGEMTWGGPNQRWKFVDA